MEPVVATTRRWNDEAKVYDDYNAKNGLDYIQEVGEKCTYTPYIHVDKSPQYSLFDKSFPYDTLMKAFSNEDFINSTNEKLLGNRYNEYKDVLLYVHGFNNSLGNAKNNAEELAKDLKDYKIVVYDWASTNMAGFDIAMCYAKDAEAALSSVRPLFWLLHVLLSTDRNLSILCHSMGSRIVVEAVKMFSHYYMLTKDYNPTFYSSLLNRLGCILFKQPDIDVINMFQFMFYEGFEIAKFNERLLIRVFAHNRDKALNVSQKIHLGIYRVGQFDNTIVNDMIKKGIITNDSNLTKLIKQVLIDASEYIPADDKYWRIDPRHYYGFDNHSYFDNSKFKDTLEKLISSTKPRSEAKGVIRTGNMLYARDIDEYTPPEEIEDI